MKKKTNLKKIALMGMASSVLLASSQVNAAQQQSNTGNQYYVANSMNSVAQNTSKTLTAEELLSQLNPEVRATYQALSPEGKALALKLANQSCKGQNECKGLNSCKTKDNVCAGHGGCAGLSKAPFANKNMAVMVAAKNMAEKRLKVMSGS
jgi:hypothetical protein